MEIIYQLLLMLPTGVEIADDKKGDSHTDRKDVYIRIFMVVLLSLIAAAVHGLWVESWQTFYRFIPKCLALSSGYFCGFFNYGVNFVQRHLTERSDWWAHLSDNPKVWPDNNKLWRRIGWKWRMVVSLSIFFASLIYYIL